MKSLVKIALLVFLVLFQINSASALSIPPSQQKITLTIEQGDSYTFLLVIQNIEQVIDLSSAGEIASWLSFDGKDNYTLYPSIIATVPVTISVPIDAEIGSYKGEIRANDNLLTEINLEVTLPLTEVRVLQELAKVDAEINRLKTEILEVVNKIKEELNTTRENLTQEILAIAEYQKNIVLLEQKISELETRSSILEESNKRLNQLTGNIIATRYPLPFAVGLVVGILCVFVFLKREEVTNLIKKLKKQKPSSKYKYEPKP